MANFKLIWKYPRIKNGILIANISIPRSIHVSEFKSREAPVTPQSKNPFGNKNHSSPKKALIIHMIVRKIERNLLQRINFLILFVS